jgi:hypothetical protein
MRKNMPTKRCSECGAKCTHLDKSGVCYECALVAKMKRENKGEEPGDHPAIVKTKA